MDFAIKCWLNVFFCEEATPFLLYFNISFRLKGDTKRMRSTGTKIIVVVALRVFFVEYKINYSPLQNYYILAMKATFKKIEVFWSKRDVVK